MDERISDILGIPSSHLVQWMPLINAVDKLEAILFLLLPGQLIELAVEDTLVFWKK